KVRDEIFKDTMRKQKGEWRDFLRSVDYDVTTAKRFIKVYEEFGKDSDTWHRLNMRNLYEIATLPPEERDVPHELPSGEMKKPDEMTVRELRELKRQLRQAEQQAESERKERERLEQENEELRNKEPEAVNAETYDRTMDFPYDVQQGNDFYAMLNDVDDLYKRYAHLKDGIEELRNIAKYDEDMQVKYRKASEFWQMLDEVFRSSDDRVEVVDASYVEIN